ncbi:MAG: ribosome-binding factor A [Patescibacteria group bacterium]|nr:ribosome-binding factor A [bacterium]MDZ4240747.1 ribosome-binding factor A [Patescibacteria group bacterium]
MSHRVEKANDTMRALAADFVQRTLENSAIVTVTNLGLSPDLKTAIVFVSVYPEALEAETLDFLKRKAGELRHYVLERIKIRKVPFFEFALDKGEKNRQRIDELV